MSNKFVGNNLDMVLYKQIRLLAIEKNTTAKSLLNEGMVLVLKKYDKDGIRYTTEEWDKMREEYEKTGNVRKGDWPG
jgi:hypothetical protein